MVRVIWQYHPFHPWHSCFPLAKQCSLTLAHHGAKIVLKHPGCHRHSDKGILASGVIYDSRGASDCKKYRGQTEISGSDCDFSENSSLTPIVPTPIVPDNTLCPARTRPKLEPIPKSLLKRPFSATSLPGGRAWSRDGAKGVVMG